LKVQIKPLDIIMIKMKSWSCLPQLTRFKFSFEKQYVRQDYLKDLPLFICFSCSFMKSRHSLSEHIIPGITSLLESHFR